MMKKLVTVGVVDIHTDMFLINTINSFAACKIDFAGMIFYTKNLIRDGWEKS